MTTNNDSNKTNVLAINFTPEQMQMVKDAAVKSGTSGAHMGRVAVLTAAANVLGIAVPEILEAKKGPKAGAHVNPEAAKYGLNNAEYARRLTWHLNNGAKLKDISAGKIDLTQDPAPRKPRAAKDSAPTV